MFVTFRSLLPDPVIDLFKRIGKYDWLQFIDTDWRLTLPTEYQRLYLRYRQDRYAPWNRDPFDCAPVDDFVMSKCLSGGPKLLCPTVEQCESLKKVDINIAFKDYQQPFPTFMVEFPEDFRRDLSDDYGCECPFAVIAYHNANMIMTVALRRSQVNVSRVMSGKWTTIEEGLRNRIIDDDEQADDVNQAEAVQRIAINFGLLLMYYGVKETGYANPDHDNLARLAKKKNKDKAERAQRLLAGEIQCIEFAQEVVAHITRQSRDYVPGSGTKCVHWRRGHFRNQPYGAGRTNKRIVFIKPILINSDRFVGDVADTAYSLRAPNNPLDPK
jgi:hypothetical protein